MNHITKLDDNTFSKEILDGVTFFHLAECGAMGNPGGVLFLTENGKVYEANFCRGNLREETIKKAFSVLADANLFALHGEPQMPAGWNYVRLGAGNHLIIRSDYYEKFSSLAADYRDPASLYLNWFKIALAVNNPSGGTL